jgi:putative pyruvate formate lyase activating enzyme
VDRTAGERGACKVASDPVVASWGPHFGEEPALVGRGGSGTIFFSGCNLNCVFCQNSDISQSLPGKEAAPAQIAEIALGLAATGCENVNFVSPSHVAHAVAEAICIARSDGLSVPVVYNTGGYDSLETLRLLEGLIEIYMPDFKWADEAVGKKYSGVPDYPKVAAAALAEMYHQVGPLESDSRGVATRGVLVRHLVMPGDLAGSKQVMDTVARIAPGTMINVMGQYRPAHRAGDFPELMGFPSRDEILSLREYAGSRGLVLTD